MLKTIKLQIKFILKLQSYLKKTFYTLLKYLINN
jgi:hypothetical protein